jgi:hypothetical protein
MYEDLMTATLAYYERAEALADSATAAECGAYALRHLPANPDDTHPGDELRALGRLLRQQEEAARAFGHLTHALADVAERLALAEAQHGAGGAV